MKNLSFYEQVGIVIPGSMLLFGLFFYVPDLRAFFTKGDITIGGFGIFVLIAYAVGQLIAALGNVIEDGLWKLCGGVPSNWVIGKQPRILSVAQVTQLELLVKQRLGLTIASLRETDARSWFAVTRQIYADVESHGRPGRIEVFNGNYGLNRGLSAAALMLALFGVIFSPQQWYVAGGLIIVSGVYLYRMYRFGVHYARELYSQFLLLTPEAPTTRAVEALSSPSRP